MQLKKLSLFVVIIYQYVYKQCFSSKKKIIHTVNYIYFFCFPYAIIYSFPTVNKKLCIQYLQFISSVRNSLSEVKPN